MIVNKATTIIIIIAKIVCKPKYVTHSVGDIENKLQ